MRENVPLASLTTLRVGGAARYVADCESEAEVREALAFAKEKGLPYRVLGQGSNVLARDEGFDGVVLLMKIEGIEETEEEESVVLIAGAGVAWEDLVDHAAAQGLWGIENLAGIPGTVGASPVQNIGAYGAEVCDVITSVRALDPDTGEVSTLTNEACAFGYRDSRFKRTPGEILLSVSFRLSRAPAPNLSYKDLANAAAEGIDLATPGAIGRAVRAIRAKKFPSLKEHGTAGSFFKNPTVTEEAFKALATSYPGLPGYAVRDGVKVPLAFVLDKVLQLRGHREGAVWLYDAQPLVLVADDGATASAIDAFAKRIAAMVEDATGIEIEREVRAFA